MTFDNMTDLLSIAIDLDYVGGAFSADTVNLNFPIDTSTLFAADGWPSKPSRIFFGGDDGVVFKDASITVTTDPTGVPEPGTLSLVSLFALALLRRRR